MTAAAATQSGKWVGLFFLSYHTFADFQIQRKRNIKIGSNALKIAKFLEQKGF